MSDRFECCVLEDSRYFMNIQVIVRNYIHYIRFKKTATESSCLCRTKLTVLGDTLELFVTRPKSFYTVLCSIHTIVYLHASTKTHTFLRYTFQWICNFAAQSTPRGFYHRCKIRMLPKEGVVRLQVQMSLTHWIPVITTLKDFHGGTVNHTTIPYEVYSERTCFL